MKERGGEEGERGGKDNREQRVKEREGRGE